MPNEKSVVAPSGAVLRVTSRSGRVRVTGEDRTDILAEKGDAPSVGPDGVEIKGLAKVLVRCPAGTDVVVGTGSGDVELHGRLGDARVTTGSGTIRVEEVRALDARTRSGDVEVEECAESCRLKTGSGRVRVGRAGEADLATGSGSVEADLVTGARVKTGSGSVELGLAEAGGVDVKAHSGSVTISVPPGLRPATSLESSSGKVRCDCDEGDDGEIRVKVGSGSIAVVER
ncbi:MAG TPA: DUF4097 family beta strand repeat-containing protein [Acidimicrobiia bacterium]|nr:DUF4097 family beta strand repeat-containing protein [Acidimicrobiia bacterium]